MRAGRRNPSRSLVFLITMCFLTAPVSPANDYSEPEGSETVQESIESDLMGDVSEPLPEIQGFDPETNTPGRNSSFDAGDIVSYVCDTCGMLLSTAGIYAGTRASGGTLLPRVCIRSGDGLLLLPELVL